MTYILIFVLVIVEVNRVNGAGTCDQVVKPSHTPDFYAVKIQHEITYTLYQREKENC